MQNYPNKKYVSFRNKTGKSYHNIPASLIENWVKRNFEYKTRKNEQEYLICCPFDSDNEFKFNINPEKGTCHYWRGDEWAGPINPKTGKRNCSFVKFVRLYKKCSYHEAIKDICNGEDANKYLHYSQRVSEEQNIREVEVQLPSGALLISESVSPIAESLVKWLCSRGYTKQAIKDAELYHIGNTVYWPYFEFDSLVYWQSRSKLNKRFNFPPTNILDSEGKTIAKTAGEKTEFLYGFDECEYSSYVAITEAIFDQVTIGEQCLASGGAILDDRQIQKLKILGPKEGVILAADNDVAGLKSIISNSTKLLRHGLKPYYSLPIEEFYVKNGESIKIKDFNEMFTALKMSLKEIRDFFSNNIKPVNQMNIIKLKKSILSSKK